MTDGSMSKNIWKIQKTKQQKGSNLTLDKKGVGVWGVSQNKHLLYGWRDRLREADTRSVTLKIDAFGNFTNNWLKGRNPNN